jgi:hypothetical protein
MLDLSYIPNSQQDIRIFSANGVAWQTWLKPRKCNYVYIICIGGGGGGGAGPTVNNNSAGGGGSGGISRVLYNAQQLSDLLYVQVGLGGTGGVGSVGVAQSGSAGTRSLVALQPVVASQTLIAISGNAVAAGGNSGGGPSAGETVSTQSTATFFTLGNFLSVAGRANVVSGSLDITPLSSQITCPGAAGGRFTSVPSITEGGSILSTLYSSTISRGISTSSSGINGTDGSDGVTIWKPFFSTGGAGGGASVTASGGRGGNGGIGSGGGGGGAGATLAQAGSGGRGGDGLVIIISF